VADDADDYAAVERGMQLADLGWHWGEPYEITWAGEFRAIRRDNGRALQAESAEELRTLIRSDYTRRPVPRRSRRTRADRQRRPSPDALEPRAPT
jgi:hypothetical protein